MMKIEFKVLMPKVVQNWIKRKKYEDVLAEAENRFKRKLSNASTKSPFALMGNFVNAEYEEGRIVGFANIKVDANNENDAKKEFKNIYGEMAKKGIKFKFLKFVEVSNEDV